MKSLDFFFFYGSTYTYLSVMRIEALAKKAKIEINWRPFNVRQIMIEMDNVPFAKKPLKLRYMWRDIERRAATHGVPFPKVPVYPVDPNLIATKVGIIAAEEGWAAEYTVASYRAWFMENRGAGLPGNVEMVLKSLGREPNPLIAQAESAATQAKLDAATDAARKLGIFGSPTFAVGEEIFWGDDRLEDAIAWRLKH